LFYNLLKKTLLNYGFVLHPLDDCVFRYQNSEKNYLNVGIHVDDIIITSNNNNLITNFKNYLLKKFYDVKFNEKSNHNYLGLNINLYTNYYELDMISNIEKIIKDYGNIKSSLIPATNDFFKDSTNNILTNKNDINKFHSYVAKLLYISRFARPDILGYVSYLTSRVQTPTYDDKFKLEKLLGYLLFTINMKLKISNNICNEDKSITINTYIDSSHGLHSDMKGRTGIIIKLGNATIFARSAKQKINTKSSAETELHGVSEEISQALWTKQWLEFYNIKVNPILLHLDNKSTIIMLLTGKSIGRNTRHISMRTFFIKQFLDNGTIKIVYTPTDKLFVDLLTKSIQGNKLIEFTKTLMYE
jgi:hypothetical protein